jgi:hypothetical protein
LCLLYQGAAVLASITIAAVLQNDAIHCTVVMNGRHRAPASPIQLDDVGVRLQLLKRGQIGFQV